MSVTLHSVLTSGLVSLLYDYLSLDYVFLPCGSQSVSRNPDMTVAIEVVEEGNTAASNAAVSADIDQSFVLQARVSLPNHQILFLLLYPDCLPLRIGISITQLHRAQREEGGERREGE